MLGTAVLVQDTPLRGLPHAKIAGHAKASKGQRVTIAADGSRFNAPDWVLIRARDRVGWVKAATLKRDPLLFVDLSHHNGKRPNFAQLVDDGYMMIVLKATQGTKYAWVDWYLQNIPRVVAAAGDRWNDTFHFTAYHYFTEASDGEKQALFFAKALKAGKALPTVRPVVDVEDGVDKKKLVAGLKAFYNVLFHETGQLAILYGGSLLRDLKIKGTDILTPAPDPWVARYNNVLPPDTYTPMGYKAKDLFAWQYAAGKELTTPTTPNFGKLPHAKLGTKFVDTNIVINAKDAVEFKKKYGWR